MSLLLPSGYDLSSDDAKTLPSEDEHKLESAWHRDQISLLTHSVNQRWNDRHDFYCGGNMFVYFSPNQVRNEDYRGPDFFVVLDTTRTPLRDSWVIWEEQRAPDLVIELLSPSTADADRTTKKRIYERTLRTPELLLYDPTTQEIEAFRLNSRHRYRAIPMKNGRLTSEVLTCQLGLWEGEFDGGPGTWIRLFEPTGEMVLTSSERVMIANLQVKAAERQASNATQRALAAEADLARLKAELDRLKSS
jgi:Uma2 family endonuclease